MDKIKIISIISLFTGLVCIYFGYNEYQILSSGYNPLFNISPDNDTKVMIIFGVAFSVSGFTGLIRGRIFDRDRLEF